MAEKKQSLFSRVERTLPFQAIRRGLALTIPVLLIGSLCLVILNLPITPHQDFLDTVPVFTDFILAIYTVTMGMFSLYATISISFCYAQAYEERHEDFFTLGAPFAALGAYLILVGMGSETFTISVFETRSLFIAIVCGLFAAMAYCAIARRQKHSARLYSSSIDSMFNRAMASVLPVMLILLAAGLGNEIVKWFTTAASAEELLYLGISAYFPFSTATLESGILYLFLNSLMWFFGIHGGNMLAGVAEQVFTDGTAQNAALIAAGQMPNEIVTKTFMDVFCSIGGAGAMLSLLLAVVFFGRRKATKRLSAFAAVPMCFNVSEIMMLGLPVLWNPTLIIPFIIVPVINLAISYFAISSGMVPIVSVDVSWTTPPLIGGYVATGGSLAGALLQGFNLLVGMIVYLPFLKAYEKGRAKAEHEEYERLLDKLRTAEAERREVHLITSSGESSSLARSLADDLERAVANGDYELQYQPQFDVNEVGSGAEALLRWKHPVYGYIYPPLVIKLAEEIDILADLERSIFQKAIADAVRTQKLSKAGVLAPDFSISVNATARMLQDESFVEAAIDAVKRNGLEKGRLIVEATEQEALQISEETTQLLTRMVDAGISLAIDDFSMGHTSLQYLETSAFGVVKLDGTIAKRVMDNSRFADIVASITKLSEQLNFTVLAEYVETAEQRDLLRELGCSYFQGYLYSPARPFKEMIAIVAKTKVAHEASMNDAIVIPDASQAFEAPSLVEKG